MEAPTRKMKTQRSGRVDVLIYWVQQSVAIVEK